MKNPIQRQSARFALALGVTFQLHAADISWDALGADDNWSTLDNWRDDADPTGDVVTNASTTHITGLGAFTVNGSTNHFLVSYANASGTVTATANMSGLSNFNATLDIFGVGRKGTTSANASRQQGGVLTLSKNSTITANDISVGSTTHKHNSDPSRHFGQYLKHEYC